MPLTDTRIRSLKPRDKRYSVSDERGLVLEVFPTGGMLWHFRYRLNGKQERVTLGRYPALSLKLARDLRDQAATQVALGNSPAAAKQQAKVAALGGTTVKEFGERYFREVAAKDRKDLTMPRRYFDKSICPRIGTKEMAEVTTDDCRQIIWAKKDQGFDAAAGQIRGLLKRIFDFGVTCGVAKANPIAGLPMRHVHKAKARERALQPGEIRAFLKATFESNVRRQFKLAVQLILLTLVRKSELLLAEKAELDLDVNEWHIPGERTKNGKPHIVYLSTQAVALIKELIALAGDSELLIPGRSSVHKPFAHNSINSALKIALQGQAIPAFTIHDLRRTASTLLHENGWPSDVVEKALNHTMGGVRGVYNRAEYSQQRREMLQFWADYIESLLATGKVSLARFKQVA